MRRVFGRSEGDAMDWEMITGSQYSRDRDT
jgi:hypothetical protein